MNRAFIAIATFTVLLGLGAAAYFYYSSRAPGIVVTSTSNPPLPSGGESTTPTTVATTTITTPPGPATRLMEISVGPVVPGITVTDLTGSDHTTLSDVAVHYLERQSGNVFQYLTHNRGITRTSNRTIPGIQSASWLPDASLAFVRYLSGDTFTTINTYGLSSDGSSGFFLPQNLSEIAVTAAGVLTLASGMDGSSASLRRSDGTAATPVFTTPLSSVRVSFAGKGQYLVFTKPSATLEGSAFLVDALGHFSRIAGPLNGLGALASPSGTWVLVSHSTTGTMHLELVNTSSREVVTLPVATIADKCVWAADSTAVYCGIPVDPAGTYAYPDDWYQGAVSFSDRIWKIDVSNRFAQLVLDFNKETNKTLDAETLSIDPLATTLAFVNKLDGSLWSYQL